ncbi:MAG: pyridoxamine 5'-phosphate oxidase family protein [bacterium]
MTKEADITADFWRQLRSDRIVMLGMEDDAPTTLRPMTAQIDGDADVGPIWFFSSTESTIVKRLANQDVALFSFVSKGHDIFATVHGHLMRSADRAAIDRLWNPWVAAWYEGGKDDPKLALMRFDPVQAEIWRDGSSFLAGLKLMFGADPKVDYADNVAKVSLG